MGMLIISGALILQATQTAATLHRYCKRVFSNQRQHLIVGER
jgi:hypothetical protein